MIESRVSWRSSAVASVRLRFLLFWFWAEARLVSVVVVRFFVGTFSNWTFSTRPAERAVPNRARRWASVVSIGVLTRKSERVESGSGILGS